MAPSFLRTGVCLAQMLAASCALPAVADQAEDKMLVSRTELRLAEFGEPSFELAPRASGSDHFYKFVTRPDIQAPRWDVTVLDRDRISPGHWFLAPYSGLDQKTHDEAWVGPYIYAPDGELVWSGTTMFKHWNVFDFKPAMVGGERMASLLYMQEHAGIVLDSTYERWTTQPLAPDAHMLGDMHAFHVLPGGETALSITLDKGPATRLQSAKIGFDGECKGSFRGFIEMNLTTQDAIFKWSARDHIGLEESMKIAGSYEEMCTEGWDSMHFNSIDKFPDGDYLLSSRHTNALYKIDHQDGHIVWRLGGVKNDFKKNFIFSRQHHARVQSQNSSHTFISIFDNAIGTEANETETNEISRGLIMMLRTDKKPMTASIAMQYDHPRQHLTNSRGSLEMMPNGNAFICWTYGSLLSEHTPDGTIIMEASTKGGFNTYRTFKAPWVGRPTAPPDVRAEALEFDGRVRLSVWVSWNGATEVATWNLYRSTADGSTTEFMVTAPRRGFETTIVQKTYASYVVVEALDADGVSLGKSAVITTERASNMNRTLVEEDAEWLQQHTEQRPDPATEPVQDDSPDSIVPPTTTPTPNAIDHFASQPTVPVWSSIAPRPSTTTRRPKPTSSSSSSGSSSSKTSSLDSQSWSGKVAKPLLTSPLATYVYGVLTVLLLAGLASYARRRRNGAAGSRHGSKPAWWKLAGQKYEQVWDGDEVELGSDDEHGSASGSVRKERVLVSERSA